MGILLSFEYADTGVQDVSIENKSLISIADSIGASLAPCRLFVGQELRYLLFFSLNPHTKKKIPNLPRTPQYPIHDSKTKAKVEAKKEGKSKTAKTNSPERGILIPLSIG